MHLRVGVIDLVPFARFTENADGRLYVAEGGFGLTMLDVFASMNMSLEFKKNSHGIGIVFENGTGDGLLGNLVDNVADIMWGPYALSPERQVGGVTGSRGIVPIPFKLFGARRRARVQNTYGILSTLPVEIYVCVALTMAVVLLTLRGLLSPSSVSITHLLAWMTGESLSPAEAAKYKTKTSAAALVGLYLFFSIVISNLFSSEMRASLTVQEGSPKIQSYIDLIGAFKKTRLLVWKYARTQYILQESSDKIVRQVYRRVVEEDSLVDLVGFYTRALVENMARGKCVFFGDGFSPVSGLSRFCGEFSSFSEFYEGFVIEEMMSGMFYAPHISEPIKRVIDKSIQRTFEAQLLAHTIDDRASKLKYEACRTSFSDTGSAIQALSLDQLLSVFILHAVLCFLSSAVAVVEVLRNCFKGGPRARE